MISNQASRTAESVARLRAAHQLFDMPRVFEDPIAVRILGAEAVATLGVAAPDAADAAYRRALRAIVVARSRFAEDELQRALLQGVRQYVVLGAGLDTSAYRQSEPDLRIFEVDHPATQAWKLDRLRAGDIAIPHNVTYAPVDFETQTLADGLARAGFDAAQPAFFSWLGVTPYLTREAIFATLGFIARETPHPSAVVFDYMVVRRDLSDADRAAYQARVERVAQLGEPWRTSFESGELAATLVERGFREVEDLLPDEINRRYFLDRGDHLKVGSGARLLRATV